MDPLKQWAQFISLEKKDAWDTWDVNLHQAVGHLRNSAQPAGNCGCSSAPLWHPPVLPHLLFLLASVLMGADTLDSSSLRSFSECEGELLHMLFLVTLLAKLIKKTPKTKPNNFYMEHPSRTLEPSVLNLFLCNNIKATNFHIVD